MFTHRGGITGREGNQGAAVGRHLQVKLEDAFLNAPLAANQTIRRFETGAGLGEFANRRWLKILGWTTTAVIIILNVKLLFDTFMPAVVLKAFYGHLGLPVPNQ